MSDKVRRVNVFVGPDTIIYDDPHGTHALVPWEVWERVVDLMGHWQKISGWAPNNEDSRKLYEKVPRNLSELLDCALKEIGGE
jgi:hypothetical protein